MSGWIQEAAVSVPALVAHAALSNFPVYFMYESMCEWCGHMDVILF